MLIDCPDIRPSLPEHQRHVYMIGQKALEEEMAALGLVWHGGTVSSRPSTKVQLSTKTLNHRQLRDFVGSRRKHTNATTRFFRHKTKT